MKKSLLIILIIIVAGGLLLIANSWRKNSKQAPVLPTTISEEATNDIKGREQKQIEKTMQISSPAFQNQQNIPAKYTCDGDDINPSLAFEEVPVDAQSLALIVDDPDAPAGTWTHWTVWNIDPATKEIAENSVAGGAIEGKTSFGRPGWGGPCPPSGTHRYFFKLYALDSVLELPAGADVKQLEAAMVGHIIESCELIGLYSRH